MRRPRIVKFRLRVAEWADDEPAVQLSRIPVSPCNHQPRGVALFIASRSASEDVEDLLGFVNLPDAGRVAGQDPNLGGCSRSTRHHVPFGERSGAERAVMSGP